jgi:hypothetical protein
MGPSAEGQKRTFRHYLNECLLPASWSAAAKVRLWRETEILCPTFILARLNRLLLRREQKAVRMAS